MPASARLATATSRSSRSAGRGWQNDYTHAKRPTRGSGPSACQALDDAWQVGAWALVSVDVARLSGKTRRVNITLPERLLAQMDGYAAQHGATRSGLIAEAAMEYLATRG